ncbi:MAG: MMPL family transporter [Corynebacteriales bacterium]|nr:MMPL family transporter [Mycobacteriales bacterium]
MKSVILATDFARLARQAIDMTTRIGKFCYRNRWWVLLTWLLAVVIGGVAAGPLFDGMVLDEKSNGWESSQAQRVLDDSSDKGQELVALVKGASPETSTNAVILQQVSAEVEKIDGVQKVDPPQRAPNNDSFILNVTFDRLPENASEAQETKADETLETVSQKVQQLEQRLPGASITLGGSAVLEKEINEQIGTDLKNAEVFSLPVTAIVLVFIFGGVVAAGVPLLATLVTVVGSFAVLYGFSQFLDIFPDTMTIVSMLGLGLSIDYGLLLVARYREELAKRTNWAPGATRDITAQDRYEAIGVTWATAGRTILFSALTVAVALCGLLFIDMPRLQAIGASGIATALAAMITSLTFTAVLLRLFGKRIKPSKRQIKKAAAAAHSGGEIERGFFARLARITQRRPLAVTLITVVILVGAAAPVLFTTYKMPGLEGLPSSLPSVNVAKELDREYKRAEDPAVIVVARTSPEILDKWAVGWKNDSKVETVEPAELVGDNLSTVAFRVNGDPQGQEARELVKLLREDRPTGQSWVAGDAAFMEDLMTDLKASLPWAIGVTALGMIVLLFLLSGSLVIPFKAIAMSVVSLGASFGVLVAVFDYGWGSEILDTNVVGGMSPITMVVIFALAMALSMDYEVFLLSRIKEEVDAGIPTHIAVRHGLQRSGKIITAAALLMMIVFAGFIAGKLFEVESAGVGLLVAVLVDATLVRCVLLPATMTLLGHRNWWAPAPLKRLHAKFGISEHQANPAPVTEPQREYVHVR